MNGNVRSSGDRNIITRADILNGNVRSSGDRNIITRADILKNKAYFEEGTNSIVLEVNPASRANEVRSIILDGAKTYSEKIYSTLETQLKRSEDLMKELETSGNFTDYMHARKCYEGLKNKLADAENGWKPVDILNIIPKVVVRSVETKNWKECSKAYFRELLDELRDGAENEKQKRKERYESSRDTDGMFSLFPTSHYKKKYKKACRTYRVLDYMSKTLEFQQYSCCAPAVKNTKSYRKA